MKRYAVISDIHGNLHALQAVLTRMAEMDVDEVICLGDIVGYGPAPGPCLDLVVKHASTTVRGNHDDAVVDMRYASQFNGAARQAILWTRDVLGPLHLAALNNLKTVACIDDLVTCIHDCPDPSAPTDYVHDAVIAAMAFAGMTTPMCLLGHTHIPIVFETEICNGTVMPTDVIAHIPSDSEPIPLDPENRYICNPGSVGQPRDADPRASFAVLDMQAMTFTIHREEYDIAAAQAQTQDAGLPNILAERLAVGA